MKIYRILLIFLFSMLFNVFLFEMPAHSEVTEKKHILILNSYSKSSNLNGYNSNNWADEIISGIESTFEDNKKNININVQYMDSAYNFSPEYYYMLYNIYKSKFNNTKFDSIIAIDDNATDFLLKYSNDLFPDTPVIFSGVDQSKKSIIDNHPLFTGLYKNDDIKSTFDVALKLHSNTKHFFIILDKSSQGLLYKEKIQTLMPLYQNKVDFSFCDDEDINIVKEKIHALPKNTVILAAADFNDNLGLHIPIPESSDILFNDCPIPVYSPRYSYLNSGIIGGMITDGTKLGNKLGEIVLRILKGEKPSDIPVNIDDSHKYIFDFNQLKRFDIGISYLPEGSKIINLSSNNYEISKKTIIYLMCAFMPILLLIIIFLLFIINKLRDTKKLLLDNESLMKTIMNSTPDIICFKDPNGRVLNANNSILDLLNADPKNYKSKPFRELINISSSSEQDFVKLEEYDNECWENRDIYRTEEIIPYKKEDIYKTYDVIRVPLFNKDGSRRGLILMGRDITEHKANEENKKIIHELKYYDKLRMEFFTNLSHELRTPLNVIFSSLQVIEGTLDISSNHSDSINTTSYGTKNANENFTSAYNDEVDNNNNNNNRTCDIHDYSKNNSNNRLSSNKTNKYLDIMKQNCYRLIKLINNFIDISKIESGYFSPQAQNIDIINVVESIVLSVADYIESKDISIIFDTEVEEKVISCDPNIIERILLNLLSNAIKFTPAGGSITVNMYYRNDSILISVKDTGIGIPIEKQDAIFERFVQVDKSLSRNREGSGIGLSLVKSLVELHDGDITLLSRPNEGSEFIIRFPAEPSNDHSTSVTDYNLSENKSEVIKIEFSDIYA